MERALIDRHLRPTVCVFSLRPSTWLNPFDANDSCSFISFELFANARPDRTTSCLSELMLLPWFVNVMPFPANVMQLFYLTVCWRNPETQLRRTWHRLRELTTRMD